MSSENHGGALFCRACSAETAENFGSDKVTLCGPCSALPAGRELLELDGEAKSVLDGTDGPPTEALLDTIMEEGEPVEKAGRMSDLLLGALGGFVLALMLVAIFVSWRDGSRVDIVQTVLSEYGISVETIEIPYYHKVEADGAPIINILAVGRRKGAPFQAKIQYQGTRKAGQNGLVFEQGGSTQSSGTFINF